MAAQPDQWGELERDMLLFFQEFDVKKEGVLGVEEITAILKSIGLRCTPEEVRDMISEVAGPSAVSITFQQLMAILKSHTHQEDEDETIRQAFETIDVNGDGFISAEDLQCFMQSLGEDFDGKYAQRMIKAATKSQDDSAMVTLEQYKATLKGKWANLHS
jgi:Ca2+-binding EF-hand superfamily protein